jgi:hypothetical protein
MRDKPLIVRIPKELAAPFSISYCEKFGVPAEGGPDYGLNVLWYGAVYKGAIRAVIGYVALPEGIYVHGYYMDGSCYGPRAFMALNKFTYDLNMPLWGYIREDNPKMWNRMLKEGWAIAKSNGTDLLVCYSGIISEKPLTKV